MVEFHKEISARKTPKPFIKLRPDGFEYVEEAYMRNELNKNYPIWSWESAGSQPVQFLGSEWVIVCGVLTVEDNGFVRRFFSPGASRIQFKRGVPHTPESVVDIDKNVGTANTNGFKRAMNRLCNIADDVYRKHVEDISLDEKESMTVLDLLNDVKDDEFATKVKSSLNSGGITSLNYDAVIDAIKDQIVSDKITEGE